MGSTIYQLKITLENVRPPVWRRVVVDADATLGHLHAVIQDAFGWEDCHLHMFDKNGVFYGVPSEDDWEPVQNEQRTKISKVLKKPKDAMSYTYDFGDSWRHKIMLEKKLAADEYLTPLCTGGRRACPPEDCGGPWGYANFIDAIRNPDHPEHEEYLEWDADGFDPEAFSLDEINARLAHLGGNK